VAGALARGQRLRGGITGLVLTDVGQGIFAALNAANGSVSGTSSGFSLRVYTPQTWAEQLVSEAAKEYREVDAEMFSAQDLEAVLRVRVFPDTPTYVSAAGASGTSSVRHVVVRDAQRKVVLQPTFTETWSSEVSNTMGAKLTYVGLEAKFSLDGLRQLRGGADQEFFITVIGTSGAEKDFKVKKKHFEHLPLR
jgi:hypothetical protein